MQIRLSSGTHEPQLALHFKLVLTAMPMKRAA
jgi:hypothetical protein